MRDDGVLKGFLAQQYEEGMTLARESDILSLVPIEGRPPQRYIASFRANGLVQTTAGAIDTFRRMDVGIWMPDDYLRRTDAAQVVTYLGPSRHPWHPNILPPYICVHLRPGIPLVDLLYACYEVWTWHLYGTGDEGLNHAASQWARGQDPARFPIDRRSLKRPRPRTRVQAHGGRNSP